MFGIFDILKIEILMIFFFSFSLTWDPMGVKISKRYFPYISQQNVFKFVLNVPAIGPHKTTFNLGIFEIFEFRTRWRTVERYGVKFGAHGY